MTSTHNQWLGWLSTLQRDCQMGVHQIRSKIWETITLNKGLAIVILAIWFICRRSSNVTTFKLSDRALLSITSLHLLAWPSLENAHWRGNFDSRSDKSACIVLLNAEMPFYSRIQEINPEKSEIAIKASLKERILKNDWFPVEGLNAASNEGLVLWNFGFWHVLIKICQSWHYQIWGQFSRS